VLDILAVTEAAIIKGFAIEEQGGCTWITAINFETLAASLATYGRCRTWEAGGRLGLGGSDQPTRKLGANLPAFMASPRPRRQ
jgi:hypothetical protein